MDRLHAEDEALVRGLHWIIRSAAVILALSVFLKVAHDGERGKNAHHQGDGAKARDDGEAPLT